MPIIRWYVFMKVNASTIGIVAVFSLITLWTSVEHHQSLVAQYGQIANMYVPLITISSFLLGAVISFLFQWGVNEVQFDMVIRLLPEADSRVMKVLFDRRLMPQSELSSDTGLSRSVLQRALTRLVSRGILSKRPRDNTNVIESQIFRANPLAQSLKGLPGLSEKRLLASIVMVFLFGISLSVLNSYHVFTLEHPIEPSLYLLCIEFFALGGLTNVLFRRKIADAQFLKTLSILPADEAEVLRIVHKSKTITQMDLTRQSKMHKMKISRIIQKFEQNGVIEKRPFGYTNRIISKI
jgi:DNA-binding MarR family transcriptional regulator